MPFAELQLVVFLRSNFPVAMFEFLVLEKKKLIIRHEKQNSILKNLTAFVFFVSWLCHLNGYIRVGLKDDYNSIPFQ